MSIEPEIPSDELPSNAPTMAVQALRFCGRCGQTWDAHWVECPNCIARRGQPELVARAAEAFNADQRHVRSAVALYFTLLSVSIGSIIVALAGGGKGGSVDLEIAATVAMAVIVCIWCCCSMREVLPGLRRIPRPQWLLAAVGLACCTLVVAHSIVALMQKWLGVASLGYLKNLTESGYGFGAGVVLICVAPAIFEELAFRGVILSALQSVLGSREALLVSALMFAILHLSIPSVPHLFLMGLVFGWLRQKSSSLYPGMLAHFTHNFLVLLIERHGSFLPW